MSNVGADDAQRERAAKNQSLFREVNERIEALAGSGRFASFICECMDATCDEPVAVTVEEYEHVRQGGNRFIVLPGHEVAEIEEVTDASERFLVVAKLGAGAPMAEQLDPRKRSAHKSAAPVRDP